MPIGGSGGREQLVNGGFEGDSCASPTPFFVRSARLCAGFRQFVSSS
jgi:hypothetical protein